MMSDTPTADEAPDLDGPRLPDRGRQRRQLISERDRQAIESANDLHRGYDIAYDRVFEQWDVNYERWRNG